MSNQIDNEIFSRPNNEAKIYDFEQFTLWTNTPTRPGFRSRLSFGERNGAARISVFTNLESGPKVLFVGMHPQIWLEFLRRFETIAKGQPGGKDKIENLDRDPNAEKTKDDTKLKTIVRNTLWFGKDENGVCWIGIEQPNVPNFRFPILSSIWHNFYKPDGTKITPQEGSAAQTIALIESLRMAMSSFVGRLRRPMERTNAPKKAEKVAGDPVSLGTMTYDEDINY